jgi:hypothetical protein
MSTEKTQGTGVPILDGNKEVNLRRLEYSPQENPFMVGAELRTKTKTVRTRSAPRDLLDPDTGEIVGATVIHTIEERDEEHFVKVFADGVRAAFDLTKTGARVFQAVLAEYQRAKMTGGYADSLTLFFFDGGLSGRAIDMSEKSFQRGLKELLAKGFLAPKAPNQFWVNPALFFKGDRVTFAREYRLRASQGAISSRQRGDRLASSGQPSFPGMEPTATGQE